MKVSFSFFRIFLMLYSMFDHDVWSLYRNQMDVWKNLKPLYLKKFFSFFGLISKSDKFPQSPSKFYLDVHQKQPSRGVLRKRCSENMQKFTGEHQCRSAISIKLQSNVIQIALWHGGSPVNSLDIFRTRFP